MGIYKKGVIFINLIILIGRLCRDPEMRSGNGNTVARYTLAVDRRFKRDGDPDADFFNCTVFGKGAEFAEKFLRQGTKIAITGRIQSDNYTNKDGQKVYSWQVIVDEQEFAESKKAAEENKPAAKGDGFVDVPDGALINEILPDEDLPFI